MSQHSEAELFQKFYETAKLMNIYLNHFPKFEKYALALQTRQHMYEVYALMVEGQKSYYKKSVLGLLDKRHEQWRMDVNLANVFDYFRFKDGKISDKTPEQLAAHRFLAISRLIDELGRMIGGWISFERQKEQQREAS
jgi:hypothetical protein